MSGGFGSSDRQASLDDHSRDISEESTTTSSIPLQNLRLRGEAPNEPLLPIRSSKARYNRLGGCRLIHDGRFSHYWAWELLALAFGMICITTIVIVLIYEDDTRLDRWALMISPNAVISFIATLARSSCMVVLAELIGQLRWTSFAHRPHKLSDLQV
jgi:hypothetical protein